MKQINYKKLIIPNIPYIFIALLGTKIAQGYRLSPGADLSQKLLSLGDGYGQAFSSLMPSFHPMDLMIGIAIAVIIRIAIYVKGKNAKNSVRTRNTARHAGARMRTSLHILTLCLRTIYC